ncbi:MAG TPA: NAD(P)H-hydrate dehydratase [Steroidobacteraceae bacterium]|nr:NAD(P)H-hydrate dehydratase [Steroidobacteraceae bacterium]
MFELPSPIYRAAQVRALDGFAIERCSIPGYSLMTRAGEAAFRLMRTRWPSAERITVLCGPGNNGGDGYVFARLAQAAGLTVRTVALSDPATLKGDARRAWQDLIAAGGKTAEWADAELDRAEVVVDAIFGIGLDRPMSRDYVERVELVNAANRPVLAIDIPSGLDADRGQPLTVAVQADCCITFAGLKIGLFVGKGPNCAGQLYFDGLGIPPAPADIGPPVAERMMDAAIGRLLPRRARTAHKGDHGRVLIVGGGYGMPGAARLAGEACLRAGAGLVTVATRAANVPAIVGGRPELICHGVEDATAIDPLIERADVIALGPGLGQDAWAKSLFERAIASARPLLVDADALNLLAAKPNRRDDWVLTPHPGEAARLLGVEPSVIQRDRVDALRLLVERYGGIVALKGAGTLVGMQGHVPALCDHGNPGMGVAGMGDVLTGIIAGVWAQTRSLYESACVGVLVHALAGDAAARRGERGMLATDLFPQLQTLMNMGT